MKYEQPFIVLYATMDYVILDQPRNQIVMIRHQWKIILSMSAGLCTLLVPFSLFIGWNIFTMFLFWLILVPLLALYIPGWVSKKQNTLVPSLLGMGIFYVLMIFMIYDHYKTDYFRLMIASGVINIITITTTHFITKPKTVSGTH